MHVCRKLFGSDEEYLEKMPEPETVGEDAEDSGLVGAVDLNAPKEPTEFPAHAEYVFCVRACLCRLTVLMQPV